MCQHRIIILYYLFVAAAARGYSTYLYIYIHYIYEYIGFVLRSYFFYSFCFVRWRACSLALLAFHTEGEIHLFDIHFYLYRERVIIRIPIIIHLLLLCCWLPKIDLFCSGKLFGVCELLLFFVNVARAKPFISFVSTFFTSRFGFRARFNSTFFPAQDCAYFGFFYFECVINLVFLLKCSI